jgi:hypothetical protein
MSRDELALLVFGLVWIVFVALAVGSAFGWFKAF